MAACIAPTNVISLASSSGGGRSKPQTAAPTGLISLPVKPFLASKRSFSLRNTKSGFASLASRARTSEETSTGIPVQFKESPEATSEETSTEVSQQFRESLVPTSEETSTDVAQQLDEFPIASTSEETSTGVTQQVEDLPEETSKDTSVAISQSEASPENEEKPQEISDASEQFDNLLNDLKNKFDAIEDKSTAYIYGSAAVVTLLVSGAVVDAINSIPLFPKVMEFVGFGYTVWFVYRYLLFKKSREELVAIFEELKQKIAG